MPTLIYNPGVRVLIDTDRHGLVDVTDDIVRGSVSLTENALSRLSLTLLNHRRKYDGVFTPNDRFHVQMKRVTWVPIMSGYLDEVPYFSVYPRSVVLKGSCTLKRLKNTLWDKGTTASVELLTRAQANALASPSSRIDGGMRDRVVALLTEVGNWPVQNIHIGRVPDQWAEKVKPLYEKLQQQISFNPGSLGTNGLLGGTNTLSLGTTFIDSDLKGTGVLPTVRGKVDVLAQDPGEWALQMRWPYLASSLDRTVTSQQIYTNAETTNARAWWKDRKILVVNPKNNKGVVLRADAWGPPEWEGYDLAMSSNTLKNVLGAEEDDYLDIRFAPEEEPFGPIASVVPDPPATQTGGEVASYPGPTDTVVVAASGTRWASRNNLKGNTAAAYDFIKANWPEVLSIGGYSVRNIAGTSTPSDHSFGLALDAMVARGEPDANALRVGNSIAQWFVANPDVFGTKYVIWNDRINSGKGWRPYGPSERNGGRHPSPTQGHRDHPHISFLNTGQTAAGPMGNPWPGAGAENFLGGTGPNAPSVALGSSFGGIYPSSGPLVTGINYQPVPSVESQSLTGPRALLNDEPLLASVGEFCGASMRNFMSAPNGDFIAWFPDYFGQYGTAGHMTIRDIEVANEGFTVAWSDSSLVTHQFTAGIVTAYSPSSLTGEVKAANKYTTMGIASVEFEELMAALFNVSPDDPRAKFFRDSQAILQRFGARVDYKPLTSTLVGEAEFWWAVHLFMRSWASQFSSEIELTYMPEVYPGMLLHLEGFKLQVYVESVTHTFDFGSGGFSTSVRVTAPSATDRSGLYGLPLAGTVPAVALPPSGPRKGERVL